MADIISPDVKQAPKTMTTTAYDGIPTATMNDTGYTMDDTRVQMGAITSPQEPIRVRPMIDKAFGK